MIIMKIVGCRIWSEKTEKRRGTSINENAFFTLNLRIKGIAEYFV